jgi:2-keto-4-pentenoate hydratase/2-oxohepta-3-ene-1,7-dioic acid hydratase in catechol pathway
MRPDASSALPIDGLGREPIRFARFELDGQPLCGIVVSDTVTPVDCSWHEGLGLLANGSAEELLGLRVGTSASLDDVVLLASIDDTADIHCVGLNYLEHQREAGDLVDSPSDAPIIFGKTARAMAAPYAELVLSPRVSLEFDWEVELGVVIGKDGSDIGVADVWDYVAGYCVVNDVTARDLQTRHKQWHLSKNVVGSTPIGPWVVGRDSIAIPPDLEVSLTVNGQTKQKARTSQLIYDIPCLISLLSEIMTLRVGDVIATGTPSGVGFKRQPPEYLVDGDVMETAIESVGTLVNVVRTSAPIRTAARVEEARVGA